MIFIPSFSSLFTISLFHWKFLPSETTRGHILMFMGLNINSVGRHVKKKFTQLFFLVEILTKSDRRTSDRFLSFLISNCSRINPRKKEKTGAQFKIHFRRFFIVLWQKAVWDLKLEGKLFWNPKNVPLHLAWTGDLIDHRCFISLVAI